jgi:hypothetical protein
MDAVCDCVNARFQDVEHTLGRDAVSRSMFAEIMDFVTDRFEFRYFKRGLLSGRCLCAATCSYNFDKVSALLYELPYGGLALDRASRPGSKVT